MPTPFIIFLVLRGHRHHRHRRRETDPPPQPRPTRRRRDHLPGRLLARRLGHHRCQIAAPVTQITFAELLELLGHTEHTSLCHKPVGGQFTTLVNTRRCCR